MKTLLALAVLMGAMTLNAQTAKVIALSPADAAEVKALYDERDAIDAKIKALHSKVADKYLMEEKPGPDTSVWTIRCGNTLSINGQQPVCPPETAADKKLREAREAKEKLQHHLERKDGWYDFAFSDDFKFIVPKPAPPGGPCVNFITGN